MSRLSVLFTLLGIFVVAPCFGGESKKQKDKNAQWSVQTLVIEKKPPAPGLGVVGYGTMVTLRVHLPDHLLVGIDKEKSTIQTISDDKNTNLLDKPLPFANWKVLFAAKPSKDGKYASVEFRAGGVPAVGASTIKIRGKISSFVASNEKEIEKKDVSFLSSVELPMGTVKLGAFGKYLEYSGSRPLKSASLEVAGKTIELSVNTTKASSTGTSSEFRAFLQPPPFEKTALIRGTIRIAYYDAIEELVIPLELTVGLGF